MSAWRSSPRRRPRPPTTACRAAAHLCLPALEAQARVDAPAVGAHGLARVAGPADGAHQLGPEPQHQVPVHLRDRDASTPAAGRRRPRPGGNCSASAVAVVHLHALAPRSSARAPAPARARASPRRSSTSSFSTTAAPVARHAQHQRASETRCCRVASLSARCETSCSVSWRSSSRSATSALSPSTADLQRQQLAQVLAGQPRAGTAGSARRMVVAGDQAPQPAADHDRHRHGRQRAHVAHVLQVDRRDAAQLRERQVDAAAVSDASLASSGTGR
jgi:hypothetical protein